MIPNIEPSLLQVLDCHRSIRAFKPEPIPARDVQRMMRVAQRASSGGAAQFYSFIRITDPALRKRISEWTGQPFVATAAEYFIACMDLHRNRRLLESRGASLAMPPIIAVVYGTIDAVLAASNLATAAEAMGYGICFVGAIQRKLDKLTEELKLPERVIPVVSLCVGVPADQPPQTPRLPADVVFHENSYHEPSAADLERCFDSMEALTYFGGWFNYLDRFYTPGKEFERRETQWRRVLKRQGLNVDSWPPPA